MRVYSLIFSGQGQDDKDGSVLYLNHRKSVMVLGMQDVLWVVTWAEQ